MQRWLFQKKYFLKKDIPLNRRHPDELQKKLPWVVLYAAQSTKFVNCYISSKPMVKVNNDLLIESFTSNVGFELGKLFFSLPKFKIVLFKVFLLQQSFYVL